MSRVIDLNKKHYNHIFYGFYFVIQAVDVSLIYSIAKYVYIKDGWVIGTNGHHLHLYCLPEDSRYDYPVGFYEILIKNKTRIVLYRNDDEVREYPDWQEVFPKHENYKKITILNNQHFSESTYARTVRAMDASHTINYEYFKKCLTMTLDSCINLDVFIYSGKKDPVAIQTEDKLALIMPLKI